MLMQNNYFFSNPDSGPVTWLQQALRTTQRAMVLLFLMVFSVSVWGETATITIGNTSSTTYAASFTSTSTNANITANATSFTRGSSISGSSSTYSSATAPYSIKFKPSSNINTSEYSDNYSISATFTVAEGYTFAPTSISAQIVTEAANYTYQAVLTDGTTSYTSNEVTSSSNGEFSFTFASLSGTALSGTVTFKIWFKSTAGNKKYFVVNSLPITIVGTVAAASSDPVCPSGISISGTQAYTAGEDIELTAALTAGNGTITYQWYKGSVASGNEVSGATTKTMTISDCTTDDAGDYYCVASKTDCSDAVNSAAYTITVAAAPETGTINDLVTISEAYTFAPTAALSDGYLYEGKRFLSLGGSGYSNGIQLKSSRQVAFKVAAGAKIEVTYTTKSERFMQIGTTSAGTELASSEVSPISAIRQEAGIVYVSASSDLYASEIKVTFPTLYSVTYKSGDGTGDDYTPTTKYESGDKFTILAYNNENLGYTAPENKEFEKWNDGTNDYTAGNEYTVGSDNVTLTAQWRTVTVKYNVTYNLNGASGDAPTQEATAAGDVITLAAAPERDGYIFNGWLCSADEKVKAAGDEYTMTAANTTFTAQWTVADCKIYSFTGGIGTASVYADNASLSESQMTLSNTAGRIKILPPDGYSFKAGDVIAISGKANDTSKDFGVYAYDAANSNKLATASVSGATVPCVATATLSGNSDYLLLARVGGTGTNVYTVEVYRCEDKADAGLAYATAEVAKTTADAKFTNALTNANGLLIAAYTSSNTDVATVDANGEVTIVAAGTATITAYSAIQTKSGVLYAAGNASYTLTVAEPTYNVTYDVNGASSDAPTQAAVTAGTKITMPAAPTYDGYNFQGWLCSVDEEVYAAAAEYTMTAAATTFTAQWTPANAVAKIGTTYYNTLPLALAAATEGQTVELLKDVDNAPGLFLATANAKTITIDLGGYTYSVSEPVGSTGTVNQACHFEKNWTITLQNGTIAAVAESGVKMIIQNYANLTLLNVTIDGTNVQDTDPYTMSNNCGNVVIGDGATIIAADGGKAFDVCNWQSGGYPSVNVTVQAGATINGAVEVSTYPATATPDANLTVTGGTFNNFSIVEGSTNIPTVAVSGGTFDAPVAQEYCAEDYAPKNNGNGTYGVTLAAQSIDFVDYITTNGTGETACTGIVTELNDKHYALSESLNSDRLDGGDGADYGLKIKKTGLQMTFTASAGKVVEITTGHISGASLSVNGSEAEDLTSSSIATHTYYSADAQSFVITMTKADNKYNIFRSINIRDPYTVSFNGNGGTPAVESLPGTPAVTLPNATKTSMNFAGWYTAATEGTLVGLNGESYTPTADVELFAHWEALSTVNTLSDLQVGGVTVDDFDPDVHTYNIVLPYGTAVADLPKITSAIATNANATVTIYPTDGPAWTDDFGGCYRQQANVTPQDPTAAVGYNDIRITIAPKDGVSIIKVATTGGTNKTVTGAYAGDGDVNLSSSTKMNDGNYIGFSLEGTTLQAGDRINVHTTQASSSGNSHIIFYDNMTDKNELYDTEEIGGVGDNIFTINSTMVGSTTAYVYRENSDDAHKWNGYVDYIEVTRAMNPVLTAITFDGVAAVAGEGNAFSVTVPATSDLANMTIVPTVIRNGAHATTPYQVTSNEGAWVVGNNTYRVMDKDGDYTDYTITLAQAEPSSDATLSALAYNGTAITLVENQYIYDVELVKGTTEVPTVTYTVNHAGATAVKTDAASLPGATTIVVTPETGESDKKTYTINFTVSTSDIITIFDGSTMSNIATSPSGAISWEIVGSTMGAGDKNITYKNVTYTRALSCGNSSTTKHFKIVIAENNSAKIEVIGMSNSSSDTRHAWLTNSTDKGEYAAAIAGLESTGYNPAEFETDWLEEGAYYLHSDNTVAILLIRVTSKAVAPKCAAPVISSLASVAACDIASLELDGTATVSDGGAVSYKWYAEGGTDVLATTAKYKPSAVGNYYVVATNTLANHRDNSTTSDIVTASLYETTSVTMANASGKSAATVTLTAVATGNDPHYAWYTCDDAEGTNSVAIPGATDQATYTVPTPVTTQYYKVVVTTTCGNASAVALVTLLPDIVPLADVTESTVWDWSVVTKVADGSDLSGDGPTVTTGNGLVIANYLQGDNFDKIEGNNGAYSIRSSSNQFYQGGTLHFHTTQPGLLIINARNNGKSMNLKLNDVTRDQLTSSFADYKYYVGAGDVTISFAPNEAQATAVRVKKITFVVESNYDRTVDPSYLGTLCWTNNAVLGGATLYEFAGKDEYNKLVFDEVAENRLEAGKPYIFMPENGNTEIKLYNTDAEAALTEDQDPVNHMYGTIVGKTLVPGVDDNMYYFSSNHIWAVKDFTVEKITVPAYYCYVDYPAVLADQPAPAAAPGRRRVTMGVNGQNTATGMENLNSSDKPVKLLINGQIFILRGEKLFDATGRLVK